MKGIALSVCPSARLPRSWRNFKKLIRTTNQQHVQRQHQQQHLQQRQHRWRRTSQCEEQTGHSSTHMCAQWAWLSRRAALFRPMPRLQSLFTTATSDPAPNPLDSAPVYKSKSSSPAPLYVCWWFVPLSKICFYCKDSLSCIFEKFLYCKSNYVF